jgi:hypothetical protein
MRRIGSPKPAFVQPKGLSSINKDAMEKVNDLVTVERVEETMKPVEKKVEETTDKVLDTLQESTQTVADKVEDVVEKVVKPLTDVLDKLDDDPRVKAVLDGITESVVEQIDGRVFSCGCFGWMFALRITRKQPQSSPSKEAVLDNKLPELPPQHEEVKESSPPKAPEEIRSETTPSTETSASA